MENEFYEIIRDELGIRCNSGMLYMPRSPDNTSLYIQAEEDDIVGQVRSGISKEEQKSVRIGSIRSALDSLKSDPYATITFTNQSEMRYVNLVNGAFDLNTGHMAADHTDMCFNYCVNARYIPKDKRRTDAFDRFCRTTFALEYPGAVLHNQMPDEGTLLLEIMGVCISDVFLKCMFLFLGESNSGKSVIIRFLEMLLRDSSAVAQVALGDLADRFYLERLRGKKLNLCPEFGPKDIQRSSTVIKKITSGESVRVEYKGIRPSYADLRCTFLAAGNEAPILRSSGITALINRMVVLIFPRSIPFNEQDPNLLEQLWAERDSIVSCALDALFGLKSKGYKFTIPMRTAAYKQQLLEQDPLWSLEQFFGDCIECDMYAKTRTRELIDCYMRYLRENTINIKLSHDDIVRFIRDHFGITKQKARFGKKTYQAFIGVKIKAEYMQGVMPDIQWNNNGMNLNGFVQNGKMPGTFGTPGTEMPKPQETGDSQEIKDVPTTETKVEQDGTHQSNLKEPIKRKRKLKEPFYEPTDRDDKGLINPIEEINPESITMLSDAQKDFEGNYTEDQYLTEAGKIVTNPFEYVE